MVARHHSQAGPLLPYNPSEPAAGDRPGPSSMFCGGANMLGVMSKAGQRPHAIRLAPSDTRLKRSPVSIRWSAVLPTKALKAIRFHNSASSLPKRLRWSCAPPLGHHSDASATARVSWSGSATERAGSRSDRAVGRVAGLHTLIHSQASATPTASAAQSAHSAERQPTSHCASSMPAP